MKKIVLVILLLFFLGNVNAGTFEWVPSTTENYHFNQPIASGEDFNLYMKQTYRSSITYYFEKYRSVGAYGNSWTTLDDCIWSEPGCGYLLTTGQDTNLFGLPVGSQAGEICELKEYTATNSYCEDPYGCDFFDVELRYSTHEVLMTLNCTQGNYYIPTEYYLFVLDNRYGSVTPAEEYTSPLTKNLTFKIGPSRDMPPLYDYNLFWSKSQETTRQYIHAWDVNEELDGNYFIKSFEVQVDPLCEIIDGGAKDLEKKYDAGSWNTITYSDQHKKFEYDYYSMIFQDGLNGFNGTDDTGTVGLDPVGSKDDGSRLTYPKTRMHKTAPVHAGLLFKDIFGTGANQIPLNSPIAKAKITLDVNATDDYGDFNLLLYPITDPNGDGLPDFDGYFAKWLNRTTTKTWVTPGGDYTLNNQAGQMIPHEGGDQQFDWNVTKAVQEWSNSNNNFGWIMKLEKHSETAGYTLRVNTSESAGINKRPKLSVSFGDPVEPPRNPETTNINLYVDVKCHSKKFHDFNITITDFDDNSIDLNSSILDLNAYRIEGTDFNANNGPPGVDIGGPYFMGKTGFLVAIAYGVIDYKTDTNYFIEGGEWKICRPGDNFFCFYPNQEDQNCYFVDSAMGLNNEIIITEDYNSIIGGGTAGGIIQKITDQQYLVCNTPGLRELIYVVSDGIKYYLDKTNVYVLDIKTELKEPYYTLVDENTEINGLSIDNDPYADIQEAKWYAYPDECGAKGSIDEWVLDVQTSQFLPPDENGIDVNVTATIKCSSTGKKAINLVTIINQEYSPGAGNILIRGDSKLIVILPDSLRMESFEIVPSKVRKGNNVEFIALIKNKVEAVDLNIEVQFDIFDEKGKLIDSVSATGIVLSQKQTEISTPYNTSALEEKASYRVTATVFLLSGSGSIPDKKAINDVAERYFWVIEEENKLETLPETNYISIIILLISVILILSKKRLT